MRDAKRIKPLLETIEKVWSENPDFRLGQLIVCICKKDGMDNLFNLEDEEFSKKLDKFVWAHDKRYII